MSPVVYYNDKNEVDSVVYYTTMSNVKASFDNFFFMFCSQRYMESWNNWMTDANPGAWDFVWRPEIFDNRDCNTLSGALYQPGNDLSGVLALPASGASYFTDKDNNPRDFKTSDNNKGKNQMQSINPLLTEAAEAEVRLLYPLAECYHRYVQCRIPQCHSDRWSRCRVRNKLDGR
jgi:hypothetical protein